MKNITVKTIRSFGPCYDPTKYLKEDWKGTILDLLMIQEIPPEDRIWVAMHEELVPMETQVSFACWCARQAIKVSGLDSDSCLATIKLAEKWNKDHSSVTIEQLRSAGASAAARAASATAYASANAANAAAYAAYAAAYAAYAASAANAASARTQMRKKQVKKLISLVKRTGKR